MLVASAHEDKGIPFDGNIMPALESITLRRKQKLIEPAFEPMIRKIVSSSFKQFLSNNFSPAFYVDEKFCLATVLLDLSHWF